MNPICKCVLVMPLTLSQTVYDMSRDAGEPKAKAIVCVEEKNVYPRGTGVYGGDAGRCTLQFA